MASLTYRSTITLAISTAFLMLLPGAKTNGCSNGDDVPIGDDGNKCLVTGCSRTLCAAEEIASTCEERPEAVCYEQYGSCEPDPNGTCGWRPSSELQACLDSYNPTPCVVTGCSGQLCADQEVATTCEFLPEYACYQQLGVCERDTNGTCGWRDTAELQACIDNSSRTPVEEGCIRDNNDACTTDADCMSGGCGGDLCFNPAISGGESTCECTAPPANLVTGCGCVQGTCSWYK